MNMTRSRPIVGLAVLLSILSLLFSSVSYPHAQEDETLFLPAIFSDYDPSAYARTTIHLLPELVTVGMPVQFFISTLDGTGTLIYKPSFNVQVTLAGRSGGLDTFPVISNNDGTYTGVFTPTIAGQYFLTPLIFDTLAVEQVPVTASAALNVEYGPPAQLEVHADELTGPVLLISRDLYNNPRRMPGLDAAQQYTCESDNPDVQASPVMPYPENPEWMMMSDLMGYQYEYANFTCMDEISGASGQAEVAYSPFDIELHDASGQEGNGFPAESFFDVWFEIRPTVGSLGWTEFQTQISYPLTSGIGYQSCESTIPFLLVDCILDLSVPNFATLNVSGMYPGPGGITGDTYPFIAHFTTPPVADMVMNNFHIGSFVFYDTFALPIPYDPVMLGDLRLTETYLVIKPTKVLTTHVYLVEGSATEADVNTDANLAELAFNLNALSCTLDFYVDIVVIITVIPKATWKTIDADGDGLDRVDNNGDGDYTDPGEHDEVQKLKDAGFFDSAPATENVYYVPNLEQGALGMTYAPNGQVAVNNSKDGDNLTFFHEKVHELDLRKDGDFDVNDSPDDPANAQGALNPGNAMNYDNMGTGLTPAQGQELDP